MELLWLIVKWLGLSVIAIAGGWYDYKHGMKKKNKLNKNTMRIFDEQDNCFQQAYLECLIRYAKGEISELNLPPSTDVAALALQYDISFFLEIEDFAGQNIESITAFVGPRPVKRP